MPRDVLRCRAIYQLHRKAAWEPLRPFHDRDHLLLDICLLLHLHIVIAGGSSSSSSSSSMHVTGWRFRTRECRPNDSAGIGHRGCEHRDAIAQRVVRGDKSIGARV